MFEDEINWSAEPSKKQPIILREELRKNFEHAEDWVNSPHDGPQGIKIKRHNNLLWFTYNDPNGGRHANCVSIFMIPENFRKECQAHFNGMCDFVTRIQSSQSRRQEIHTKNLRDFHPD